MDSVDYPIDFVNELKCVVLHIQFLRENSTDHEDLDHRDSLIEI